MHKRIFMVLMILSFFIISVSPLGSSAPPSQIFTGINSGITIRSPSLDALEVGTGYKFHWHIYNESNGLLLTNTTASCFSHWYNQTGSHQLKTATGFDGRDFELYLDGLWNSSGIYSYIIECNTSYMGGSKAEYLYVNPSGEYPEISNSLLNVGLLFLLVALMFVSLTGFINSKGLYTKFALFWVTYLLAIGFSFGSWNIARNLLMSGMAISSMFKIMFYVLTIGLFPAVIIGFGWFVYTLYTINKMEDLLNRGIPYNEAKERI